MGGRPARGRVYSVREHIVQGVELLEGLAGPQLKLGHADTPLINEDDKANLARPLQPREIGLACPHCTVVFAESEYWRVQGRMGAAMWLNG